MIACFTALHPMHTVVLSTSIFSSPRSRRKCCCWHLGRRKPGARLSVFLAPRAHSARLKKPFLRSKDNDTKYYFFVLSARQCWCDQAEVQAVSRRVRVLTSHGVAVLTLLGLGCGDLKYGVIYSLEKSVRRYKVPPFCCASDNAFSPGNPPSRCWTDAVFSSLFSPMFPLKPERGE